MKGEIGDLLAKLELVRAEIKRLRQSASDTTTLRLASDMEKELKRTAGVLRSGVIRNAMKRMMSDAEDEAAKAGKTAGQRFMSEWAKEIQKGRRGNRWLPWIGAGVLGLGGAVSGLAGVVGSLGVAGIGAAAGLGALAASAASVLGPVRTAFTTIDALTSAQQKFLYGIANTGAGGKQLKTLMGGLNLGASPGELKRLLASGANRQQIAKLFQISGASKLTSSQQKNLLRDLSGLDPSQMRALVQMHRFDTRMSNVLDASQPQILKLYSAGLAAITPVLKFIPQLAKSAAAALTPLIHILAQGFKSKGFADFMHQLSLASFTGIKTLGESLINFGKGFAHIFEAFAKNPAFGDTMNALLKMSQAFSKSTASKTGGFAQFMHEVAQNTPLVIKILKQLVQILGDLILALGSGFGRAMLQGISFLLGLIISIDKHVGPFKHFVDILIGLILLSTRFGSLSIVTGGLKALAKTILKLEIVKSVGTWFSDAGLAIKVFAKTAILWMGNMMKKAVLWAAGMIADMATAVAGWIAGLLGIDAATAASAAFIVLATGGIILILAAIVIAVYEFWKNWKTVWRFVSNLWQGLWEWMKKTFDTTWLHIKNAFWRVIKFITDIFLQFAIDAVRLAADAFSWVPGLGPKLKSAEKDVEKFAKGVNKWLDSMVKHRTIPVTVQVIPGIAVSPGGGGKRPVGGRTGAPPGGGGSSGGGGGGGGGHGGHGGHGGGPPPPGAHAAGTGMGGAAPGWAWVGEAGPELAYFHGGETVLPSHVSMAMGKPPGYASGTAGSMGIPVHLTNIGQLEKAIDRDVTKVINHGIGMIRAFFAKMSSPSPGAGGAPPGHASGPYQAYALSLFPRFGWGAGELGALIALWNQESGWNPIAQNPTSTAYGIAQFLDTTWGPYGPKTSDPYKQIFYGEEYIKGRYHTPSAAWAHEVGFNWYGGGGRIPPGGSGIVGDSGLELAQADPRGGVRITPLGRGQSQIPINIYTNEINPKFHAAQLGWELARRSG